VLKSLKKIPLYARVDLIFEKGNYDLMELELVEPSLYFTHFPESAGMFCQALEAHLYS